MLSPSRSLAIASLLGLVACGASSSTRPQTVDQAKAVGARDPQARKEAPAAFATADRTLAEAEKAASAGDNLAAELLGERAVAEYLRAVAIARGVRAEGGTGKTAEALARAEEERTRYADARVAATREHEALDRELRLVRESTLPQPSKEAAKDREVARLAAARSLAEDARLLCLAGKLEGAPEPEIAKLTAEIGEIDKALAEAKDKRGPDIDRAARAREACLEILSRTAAKARVAGTEPSTDKLLSELSNAGWEPRRDERGVVLTMRDVFDGKAIKAPAKPKLEELARIAKDKSARLLVVLHDQAAGTSADLATGRLDAVKNVLTSSGIEAARIAGHHARDRLAIADPRVASLRSMNDRLEIVLLP